MLDVASLQQFDFFSNFTLYAGENGLTNIISNVVVLDYEGLEENFFDFHEGDFVLTNLLYAKETPDKIYTSFSRLMTKKISAIAIKSIFYKELPENVRKLANEQNVPIFFFHSIYIEDVILNITDYLRSFANYNYYENLIDSLIHSTDHAATINEMLENIVSIKHEFVSAMYISYKKKMDDFSIQRNINALQLTKKNLNYTKNIFFIKYKKGFLFLYFSIKKFPSSVICQNWDSLLLDLHINRASFHIGIDDQSLSIKKTELSIQRAIYSNFVCKKEDLAIQKYSGLHLYNLILPFSENVYVVEYLNSIMNLIRKKESNKEFLVDTLYSYVNNNFRIDKTAAVLFQHPNTIRYRISKLKTIVGIENEFEFQVTATLIVKMQL